MTEKEQWECPDCARIINLSDFSERTDFLCSKMKHQLSHLVHELREEKRSKTIAESPLRLHKVTMCG